MSDFLEEIAKRFNAKATDNVALDKEYLNEQGLRVCKVCNQPREKIYNIGGKEIKARITCKCQEEEMLSYNEKFKSQERERNRNTCFAEPNMMLWTFAHDDNTKPNYTQVLKNYVNNFETMKLKGKGLLLHGKNGTGKSYGSACICNALIDKDYRCLMVNLPTLINKLQSFSFEERKDYIEHLNSYSLIVFDDLGVERNSEYMKEQVFTIIDGRYRSNKPFIVTTNLTKQELVNNSDKSLARIYDRIIEKCYPFEFEGGNRRYNNVRNEQEEMKNILGL